MDIKIAPSILNCNFGILKEELSFLERENIDLIHLDIMDGHFVPNISFGIPIVESIMEITSLPVDAHLMIDNPQKFVSVFADLGVSILTVHQEVSYDLNKLIKKIKDKRIKTGISINPPTPISKIKRYLEKIDLVLIMSVFPGFGGQRFISSAIKKIEELRDLIDKRNLKVDIEVDGGINLKNAKDVINAGANILVVGGYIFNSKDKVKAIRDIVRLKNR